MSSLANQLIHKGVLKTALIIDAFSEIPREPFTPSHLRLTAERDVPLSIGYGQMLPAPSVIAFMIELLEVKRDDRVLVAGFGLGWVSTIMSYIVGPRGHVTSIDVISGLEATAVANMGEFHFISRDHIVDTYTVSIEDDLGFEKHFDHVIVINPMFSQWNFEPVIKDGGNVVLPRDNIIYYYRKLEGHGERDWQSYSHMRFLPTLGHH